MNFIAIFPYLIQLYHIMFINIVFYWYNFYTIPILYNIGRYRVFAVRQICEKYLANWKDVFWAFMDLEKAYDTINQHGMRQML